jgi:hypothetical protein
MATGIFVRIASEAAEADAVSGKTRITLYWRVVKEDGSLNPKFPGGAERQSERAPRRRASHSRGLWQTAAARGDRYSVSCLALARLRVCKS